MDSTSPEFSAFSSPGGITVRRALELPGLRSGLPEVVAGAERLQRTVRWVHAGEVPNIASLLKGGELLLTTGYGVGTRPAEQRAFVRKLAERASPRSSSSWVSASRGCPRPSWRRRGRRACRWCSCTAKCRS